MYDSSYTNSSYDMHFHVVYIYVTFSLIRYTPQTIELEHKLKPFIPDYIPAVGDIDAFIKVSVKVSYCTAPKSAYYVCITNIM